MSRRALIAAVVVVTVLLGAGGVLYAFGTPQAPRVPAVPVAQVPAPATPQAQPEAEPAEEPAAEGGAAEAVATEVPPPDPNVPLAIEIPGCVCHSDDPAIVEEHASYRMNQCAGCHAGSVPTGQ